MVLEDGGGMAALGGGTGQRLKIAATALGSSGGRRTCKDGIGIRIIKAYLGLTITMLASALARMAREATSNARDIRWQQWQGDRHIATAVAVLVVKIH